MRERLVLCLFGAWLMGSVMLFVIAPTNFHLIDDLLAGSPNASFRSLVREVGSAPTRELLRYLASEYNREFFLLWNVAQLGIGGSVLLLCWRGAEPRVRYLALGASALVVVLLVVLTPWITSAGRGLDFVPRQPPPPELAVFKLLHVFYTGLDLAKVAGVALATYWLLRARAPRATPEHAELPENSEETA